MSSSPFKISKEIILSSSNNSASVNDVIEKERHKKYEKIMEYLKNIKIGKKGCIKPASKENTYTLNSDIGLYKQIGSVSAFGVVYKSININKKYVSNNIPTFVTKIQLMSDVFKYELQTLQIFMNLTDNHNIPCFPYIYNIMECNNIIKDKNYPTPLQKATKRNKYYTLILYELASGDLISFLKKKERDYKIWKNCYEQLFMSIFAFHSIIKYNHNDCHSKNFLYRKIKKGGCFCYIINGIHYYIENLGYVWMIWDYSNARPLDRLSDYYWIYDYLRIYSGIRHPNAKIDNIDFRKPPYEEDIFFGFLDNKIKVSRETYNLQDKLAEHLYYKTYKQDAKKSIFDYFRKSEIKGKRKTMTDDYFWKGALEEDRITEYEWFKMMLDSNLLFSKIPIGEVISTTNFTNPNHFYYGDRDNLNLQKYKQYGK